MKSSKNIEKELNELYQQSGEKERELIDLVSSIYQRVKEKQEAAVHKVQDTAHSFNDIVHKHPWHYIGSAALGGFLIGLILRRTKCHK